tara:strand:+ start:1444 stop:2583 length:1140 start_codon:yes stop_codon:yes gene_type:complete
LNKKIGIIGGGQLGKMILDETNKIDLEVSILDPNKNSPCKNLTKNFIQGDFNDFDTVLNFGLAHDIISYEIEHINVDALDELVSKGIEVQPSPEILRIIQDKNLQKSFFKENNFPTSDFSYFNSKNDLLNSFKKSNLSFPCVWKKTKFGYDGFGVKILNTKNDFSKLPDAEMIIEDLIEFKKELSVIVAVNKKGDIKAYETVEMEFNPDSNQVEFVISPANISENINRNAKKIAYELAKKINLIGLLAVEMFLTNDDKILINEIAPRPHNSGHFSIDACPTSQFKQHINSIMNFELGETSHQNCAVMLNLVGGNSHTGEVKYENLDLVKNQKNVYIHIYGKKITRPNRKMGHVTVICDNFASAYKKAKEIKEIIKVKSY